MVVEVTVDESSALIEQLVAAAVLETDVVEVPDEDVLLEDCVEDASEVAVVSDTLVDTLVVDVLLLPCPMVSAVTWTTGVRTPP